MSTLPNALTVVSPHRCCHSLLFNDMILLCLSDVTDDYGGADIPLRDPDSVCRFLSDDTACD